MGGKTRPPYAAEFRQQILGLYATGRRIVDLSKEFGVSEQSISTWVKRSGQLGKLPDKGMSVLRTHRQARVLAQSNALSAQERTELEWLRKELQRVQTERDILAKATAWFAAESGHGAKRSTR